ncbi:hypothetical protein C7M84_022574 [Penaeus vannamei]|uniref:Uncharacterized protein n=1 Tax=Penaeus vannamei TaxID=6689 RepID=A0A423U6C5_PENVA|nr:hypothetical protein C7M84_022574 [Penaeus vannamei]
MKEGERPEEAKTAAGATRVRSPFRGAAVRSQRMLRAGALVFVGAALSAAGASYVSSAGGLSDAFLRELVARMGSGLADPPGTTWTFLLKAFWESEMDSRNALSQAPGGVATAAGPAGAH